MDIENSFRQALAYFSKVYGRGFQAKICKLSGAHPPNVNAIIRKDGSCSEDIRRALIDACKVLLPGIKDISYDDFLNLGQWIIDGKDPDEWIPPNSGSIVITPPTGHPNLTGYAPVVTRGREVRSELPFEKKRPPRQIPVISWVIAGVWTGVEDPFPPGYAEEFVSISEPCGPNTFALRVKGDSMEPEFVEGDIILVDPAYSWSNHDYIIAKNGEGATFKQIVIDGPNTYLRALNKSYKPIDMTGKDFRVVGVVIQKVKKYKG